MATYKLGQHSGKLCVIASEPSWTEPVMVHLYWPICNETLAQWREYLGCQLDHGWSDAPFYLSASERIDRWGFIRRVPFVLTNGGSTKPIHVEQTPIPKPRTRCETWWHQGGWFKRTAKGIVKA
jgi:hypothetical protein